MDKLKHKKGEVKRTKKKSFIQIRFVDIVKAQCQFVKKSLIFISL